LAATLPSIGEVKNSWSFIATSEYVLQLSYTHNDIVARMRRLYKTGIGLATGFIGSHTVTHNYSVYTLTASQFAIALAESPYNYN
jgi:hypothetical protein